LGCLLELPGFRRQLLRGGIYRLLCLSGLWSLLECRFGRGDFVHRCLRNLRAELLKALASLRILQSLLVPASSRHIGTGLGCRLPDRLLLPGSLGEQRILRRLRLCLGRRSGSARLRVPG